MYQWLFWKLKKKNKLGKGNLDTSSPAPSPVNIQCWYEYCNFCSGTTLTEEEKDILLKAARERSEIVSKYDQVSWISRF